MSGMQRVGELEIDQDLGFQQRMWTAQRVGWATMAVITLAALIGLLGPGPLSKAAAGEKAGPLQVEYQRFERFSKPTTLRVTVASEAAAGGEVRLWLDRQYAEAFQVQHVTPPPDRVEAASDRLTYVFDVPQPGQAVTIVFDLEAEKSGLLRGRMGLDTGPAFNFSQMVYP
jgi:hypothetical protein